MSGTAALRSREYAGRLKGLCINDGHKIKVILQAHGHNHSVLRLWSYLWRVHDHDYSHGYVYKYYYKNTVKVLTFSRLLTFVIDENFFRKRST